MRHRSLRDQDHPVDSMDHERHPKRPEMHHDEPAPHCRRGLCRGQWRPLARCQSRHRSSGRQCHCPHHRREWLAGRGVDQELGQQQVGLQFRLRPGHPQHAMAVAHHLGQVPGEGLRGLTEAFQGVDTGSRGVEAGSGGEDRGHRSEAHLPGGGNDGQAQGQRRAGQDHHRHRERQLLVQQLSEYRLHR